MSPRAGRVRALIVVCGVAVLLIATATSVALAAGNQRMNLRLLQHCGKLMAGEGTPGQRAAAGPANPQVAAELSIFRATRTSADTLPAASNLGQALAGAQAASYDPSASVLLNLGSTPDGAVYAVPATLGARPLPAACAHLHSLAGLRVALALRTQETGSGPGVCVITTHREPATPPVSALPGKRPLPGARARTVAVAGCESLTVMASYFGSFGGGLSAAGVPVALLPDGVSSLTATFADGHQIAKSVTGNLLAGSGKAAGTMDVGRVTRARLLRLYDASTPVTVTEDDAAGTPIATFDRPASLVPEFVRETLLLKRLFTLTSTGSTDSYVSCSARTHRCVAVVVSSSCDSRSGRCKMSRQIERYRYVTRRPPRGSAGPVPSGPIRARAIRYVRRPGRLSLVLSGAPQRRVDVLTSVSCFSGRNGGTSSGLSRQPLQVAVPSRTYLATIGRHRACGVGVLVVSSQRGPIHIRLAHG